MPKRIAIIVLAAGKATRFASAHGHKLLAPLRGMAVVRWSVLSALDAAVGEVIVVTGADATDVTASVADLPVRTIHADEFANGMSASLRRGVAGIRADADAVIVALADQPTMRAEAYRRVAAAWAASGAAIVTPRYAGASTPAHPTLFSAPLFDELLELRGDVGARAVVARDPTRVMVTPLEWTAPRDIDTVDDLAMVETELPERE